VVVGKTPEIIQLGNISRNTGDSTKQNQHMRKMGQVGCVLRNTHFTSQNTTEISVNVQSQNIVSHNSNFLAEILEKTNITL
jgi:hypothetical protein